MECLIERDGETGKIVKVIAPNGQSSALYEEIKKISDVDPDADFYVASAIEQGLIRNDSKEEKALAVWSKIYTEPFMNWFGNWNTDDFIKQYPQKLDANGEPLLKVNAAGELFFDNNVLFSPPQTSKHKYTYNVSQKLKTSLDQNSFPKSPIAVRAFTREQQALQRRNPSLMYIAEQQDDGKIKIDELIEKNSVGRLNSISNNILEVTRHMQKIFPNLSVRVISEQELEEFDLSGSSGVQRKRINSFVKNDVIYLVADRFSGDMLVEEWLHPFVHILQKENSVLFENLLDQCRSQYSDIAQQVSRDYLSQNGFKEQDRQNELVSKVLSSVLQRKITEKPQRNDFLLEKLIREFFKFLHEIFRKLTGKNKLFVGDLPTSITIDELTTLLATGDVRMSTYLPTNKVYFNLSSEKQSMYSRALAEANPRQREIVEKLLDHDVVFYEDTHSYVHSQTGNEYTSVTRLIKGVIDQEDEYSFNREIGKEFDFILNSLVLGISLPSIKKQLKILTPELAGEFYEYCSIYISGIKATGSIIIPQLLLADDKSLVAGTLDLLIIDPQGNLDIIDLKVSKNTILGKGYLKQWPIDNAASVFYGQSLSTKQQHGVQQHAYKKLIELRGGDVRSVRTLHFKIKVDNEFNVSSIQAENTVDHSLINYSNEVNAIINTPIPNAPKFQTLLHAQALPENAPTIERIHDVVAQFKNRLQERKKYFENINNSTRGKTTASPEYLTDLSETINQIDDQLTKNSPAGAFYQLLKFIHRDLRKKTEQIAKTSIAKEKLIDFLLEAEKDLLYYKEILDVPRLQLSNAMLERLGREALNYADDLRTVVDQEVKTFITDFIQQNSSRNFTLKQLEELFSTSKDISSADYYFGDLATSTDPILATFDKVYKRKLQEIYDATDKVAKDIVSIGNQLSKLQGGKKDYDFMYHQDEEGKPTGTFLRKIGNQYWALRKKFKEATLDENGTSLKYKEVFNLQDADPNDLEYNLQLLAKKNDYRKFCEAERVDSTGTLVDGEFHKYTDEFKKVREKYETLHVEMIDDKVVFSEWRKRSEISEQQYRRYKAQYYSEELVYLSPVKDKVEEDFVHLGRVVERRNQFVKGEFIEVREISGQGMSLLDSQYEKLMSPTTELERLQKSFYETWVKHFEEQIEKLPADVRRRMAGRLPVIRDKFVGAIKEKSPGMVKGVLKSLRNLNPFDLKVYSQSLLTNEHGEIENQVPIYYVGDYQNEESIKRLEGEIRSLKQQLSEKKVSYEQYKALLKKTNLSLSIEKGKITRDEISTDMVVNLVEFSKMAENYKVMSSFESTVEAVQRTISKRKYFREGSTGIVTSKNTKEFALIDGAESLTAKRLEKWMEMVFYRINNPYQSQSGQIIRKMMQYMSLKNVALNPFGQVNNFVMGHLNNLRESIGSTFWEKKHYSRSIAEYHKEYLPGLFEKSSANLRGKDDYYEINKPYSKFEALASHFRMMRKLQSADLALGSSDRIIDAAYIMQESAEYSIQTQTGMSALMAKMLTHEKTGEKLSVYDAYEYDRNTFTLKLKEGFTFTDRDRHDLTNLIYEINKRLHGNYAYEDRMVIQSHLLGELGAQFHKWVYPTFKAIVGKGYIDENQGEMEGRHRSVWSFFVYLKELRDLSDSWEMLKPHQKLNVYKSTADLVFMFMSFALYHLFLAIGQGIDEEDENTRKLVNWLTSQSDRVYDEVAIGVFLLGTQQQYQLLKSPIALLGTAKDFMEVISEAIKLPFPPYDDMYFKNGVNKDELKLKKELMDVIPVLNLINRWDSYETVKQFYIR